MDSNSKQALAKITIRTSENPKSDEEQTMLLPPASNDVRLRYGDAERFMLTFNKNIQAVAAPNPERAFLGTAPSLRLVHQTYNVYNN